MAYWDIRAFFQEPKGPPDSFCSNSYATPFTNKAACPHPGGGGCPGLRSRLLHLDSGLCAYLCLHLRGLPLCLPALAESSGSCQPLGLCSTAVRQQHKPFGETMVVAHRLLKNDIPGHEYLLLTERLLGHLAPTLVTPARETQRGQAAYLELGEIRFGYLPRPLSAESRSPGRQIIGVPKKRAPFS